MKISFVSAKVLNCCLIKKRIYFMVRKVPFGSRRLMWRITTHKQFLLIETYKAKSSFF